MADPHADPLAGLKEATSFGHSLSARVLRGSRVAPIARSLPREHNLQGDFRLAGNRHCTREDAAAALMVAAVGIRLTSVSEPAVSVAAGTPV